MARLIRWQVLFAALGILIIGGLLAQLSLTRQTVNIPVRGGSYIEGMVGTPQFLNPLLANTDTDRAISGLVFEGLTTLQPDGSVIPALAESWDFTSSADVYTFTLRENARWHDGEPVTTEDFLFTVELIRSPSLPAPNPLAELWSQVQVEALDNRRLRFTLERPYAPFLSYTTLPLLPAHVLESIAAEDLYLSVFNLDPIGTGPFRVVEVQEEEGIFVMNLEANPFYYRRLPFLEGIQFRFYPDEASLVEAMLQEEVDGAFGLSQEALEPLLEQPDFQAYHTYLQAYTILFLNTQSTVLADERIRMAIALGLDHASLVEKIGEETFLANGPIAPISWAYKPDLSPQLYDFEQASNLLEESGWHDQDGDGIRNRDLRTMELTLLTRNIPEERAQLAWRIKQQLAPLGIAVRVLVIEDPDTFRERLESRDFDLLLYGWGQLGRDPDEFALWHSSQIGVGGSNLSSLQNEDIDLLLQHGRATMDQDRRTQIYWRFQEIFTQEVPAIPLYYPVHTFVSRSRVRGMELAPLNDVSDRFRNVTNWYIKTQTVIVRQSEPAPRYEGGEQP
jgi:peptide/nickel transport system substrate-binding protein